MLKGEFSVGFTRAYCSGPSGEREPRHPAKDISLGDMDFHKIWQQQCEATRTIRGRFGVMNALDYLVGEKLLTFARAADEDSEFAAELPRQHRPYLRQVVQPCQQRRARFMIRQSLIQFLPDCRRVL